MTTMENTESGIETHFTEGSWPEVLTRPVRAFARFGEAVLRAVTHPNPQLTSEYTTAMEKIDARRSPLDSQY